MLMFNTIFSCTQSRAILVNLIISYSLSWLSQNFPPYLINNLVFSLLKPKILVQLDWGEVLILDSNPFYFYTLPKFFPCRGLLRNSPWFTIEYFHSKLKILVQLDGGIVHILTMLDDVAHFTVINRAVAHCFKNVGHPGSMLWIFHGNHKLSIYINLQLFGLFWCRRCCWRKTIIPIYIREW